MSNDCEELIRIIRDISKDMVQEAKETKAIFEKDELFFNATEVEGYIRGIYTLLTELESATIYKFRDYEEDSK